jgi:hypothetical protein
MSDPNWRFLNPKQAREAFLQLNKRDIRPLGTPLSVLIEELTRFGLLEDPEIRTHFEGIRLPHSVSKREKR